MAGISNKRFCDHQFWGEVHHGEKITIYELCSIIFVLPRSAHLHIGKYAPHIESSQSSQMQNPQTMMETTSMCHSEPETRHTVHVSVLYKENNHKDFVCHAVEFTAHTKPPRGLKIDFFEKCIVVYCFITFNLFYLLQCFPFNILSSIFVLTYFNSLVQTDFFFIV